MTAVHSHPAVMTDERYQRQLDALEVHPDLRDDNITLNPARFAGISTVLLIAGAVGILLTIVGGFVHGWKHALASYEVGVMAVTAPVLGSIFFMMAFQMLNTSWSVTIRRTMENIASLVPVILLLLVPIVIIELISGGLLLTWIGLDAEANHLMEVKKPYLNVIFFLFRCCIYAGFWLFISHRLRTLSLEQDRSGNRWLTRKMRYTSGWGLLAFALTTAFFSFDFLMSMDYRFFSTMWGVYFFAASAFSALALTFIVTAILRGAGKLTNLVTAEHYHDLGKLQFAFVVFWAYIAFGQYFLIWYGNIPEETTWFIWRQEHFMPLTVALILGHFVIPFFALISRVPKKRTFVMLIAASWLFFFHILDMAYIIRPMVYTGELSTKVGTGFTIWLDVVAVGGVLCIFAAFLLRRLPKHPLVPIKDPRLPLCMSHRNYV